MTAELPGAGLYVWEAEGTTGWYTIGTFAAGTPVVPLVFRRQVTAEGAAPVAEAHRRASGEEVRLARYKLSSVVRRLP